MTWPLVPISSVMTEVKRPVVVAADEEYREIGIRSYGRGIFHKPPVKGLALGDKRVFEIHPGDFVLNIVFAWEGAVAIAGEGDRGRIGSHRFPTYLHDAERLEPRFLLYYFRTKPGLELLLRVSPGGAGRNRTLSREAFVRQKVPLPPLDEQRRTVSRLEHLLARLSAAEDVRATLAKAGARLPRATTEAVYERLLRTAPTRPLGDLVSVAGGGTPDTNRPDFWDGPIPWVCPKDMKRFEIDSSIDTITESATTASPAKLIDSPAVLVVVRGMILVRTAPVAVTKVPVAVNQDMKALLPEPGLDAEFLAWMLRGAERRILAGVETSGHGTKRLPPGVLERIPIPMIDAAEQAAVCREMRAKMATTDAIEARVAQSDRELALLRDRLLNSAFAGDL